MLSVRAVFLEPHSGQVAVASEPLEVLPDALMERTSFSNRASHFEH